MPLILMICTQIMGGCVEAFCGRLWASVGLFSGNRGSIYVGLHRGAGACSLFNKGTKAVMVVGFIRGFSSGYIRMTMVRGIDSCRHVFAQPRSGCAASFWVSTLGYYIREAILARCLATSGKSSLFDGFLCGEDVRFSAPRF